MGENLKILFLGEAKSANTQSWVAGLRKAGCEVLLASARSDGSDGAIPIGNPALPARLRLLLGVGGVRKMIADFKPDILIAYRVTSYGYLGAQTGFSPLVVAAQNEKIVSDFSPKLMRPFLSYCARKAISKASLLHAWSENVADGLKHFGARPEQILTMHRGIDGETFFPPQKQREFNAETLRLISTRSLHPQYKLDRLIAAFALLKNEFKGISLTIAGAGPQLDELRAIAAELGVADSVSFPGLLPPPRLAELLRESDVYVSLIDTEGLSSSLLEACACGVFPAVADIAASRTLIQSQKNGALLKSGTPHDLAAALSAVLRDRGMLSSASEHNARLVAGNYERSRNLAAFLERYRQL